MTEFVEGFENYLTGAPALAFLAAFVGGILASLTPCVYPMIPVTAAYIGSNSAGETPMRGFLLSVSYVMGIAVMYSALGAVAALTGRLFGSWASSPIVYLIMANLFILLGLSMLDVFMLPLPAFLQGGGSSQKRAGYAGAFLVGIAAAFVASPCTAPILFSILAIVATQKNVVYGISLLFTFALGMGLLLVIVGTFAGALAALPKSGMWMEKIKKGFGWLLILVAEYFLVQAGRMWL